MKDKRHKTVKILIETGNVVTFSEIFEHIPKTKVADQSGVPFNRIIKIIDNVNEFKVNDIFLISGYFEIDAKVLFELIDKQKCIKKTANKGRKRF